MQEFRQPNPPVYVVKKRSLWPWVIAGLIIVTLIGFLLVSLAANVSLLRSRPGALSARPAAGRFSEVLIEGSGEDKIVIIPVEGLISFTAHETIWERESMASRVVDSLQAAEEDPKVKGVILKIDSPGGGITASDVIHHQVNKFKASGKKVVAALGDLAASGGYYVACPADRIVAYPTTITGSIGVIMYSFNLEGLMTKVGLKAVTIKAGEQKDLLSPFRPLTHDERVLLQEVVDEMFDRFVGVISEGRNLAPEEVTKIAGGRVFTGEQALALGLVDKLGYRDEAVREALNLTGLKEARIVEYKRTRSLLDLFQARVRLLFSASRPVDFQQLLQPSAPRLMYLWTL